MRFLRPLVVFSCILLAPHAYAQDMLVLHEQEIRAGLIYNFLKYTEWPPDRLAKDASMTVCIFGSDPFDGYLKPMAGRTVNQRSIAIRQVKKMEDTQSCHLLYVNAKVKEQWQELRSFLSGKSVLTVSDFKDFSKQGGMIEFGRKDNHIDALLNIDTIAASQLRVQDRLLRLVSVVHGEGPE